MSAVGSVRAVRGGVIDAALPGANIGLGVRIGTLAGSIVAVDGPNATIAVAGDSTGVASGAPVRADRAALTMPLGTCALGRAIDAAGRPLDGARPLHGRYTSIDVAAPLPHERQPVSQPLWTGVRALDTLLTIGRGARIGLFGAPGAGKSTLMESIVTGCDADAVVVGLVGERGREAQRWIDVRDERTTVVCATSDRSAAERIRAAHVAFAQAAALRRRGLHVVLLLDSLARVAQALRERAVAAGEIAGRGGYPPSVFAGIAQLVETAGCAHGGSISLIATVLDDGDARDPVSDCARSLLDGHIALSSRLAHAGRFPAIDVLASASRTMGAVVESWHARAAAGVREALAHLDRIDDARMLGIVAADARTETVIAAEPQLDALLRQGPEPEFAPASLERLAAIADTLRATTWISPQT